MRKPGNLLATLAVLSALGSHSMAADRPVGPASAVLEPRLGATLPVEALLTREDGMTAPLGGLRRKLPAVLLLSWFRCPNLCNLSANGLVEAVRSIEADPRHDLRLGQDYEILSISIDPTESSRISLGRKRVTDAKLQAAARGAEGWHYYTANDSAIRKLADSVGFRYAWDPGSRQYSHPAGLVFVDEANRITGYLGGIRYPPEDLRRALRGEQAGKALPKQDESFLSCFHYDPRTGRYSMTILGFIRVIGLFAALALVLSILLLKRGEDRR